MSSPRAVSSFLALSGLLLLLAVSVAATGYGASPGENAYAGGHDDAAAGSKGYAGSSGASPEKNGHAGGHDDAAAGSKNGYGSGPGKNGQAGGHDDAASGSKNGYGSGPGKNGHAGGHDDAASGSKKGYGSGGASPGKNSDAGGHDDAAAGSKGYGNGDAQAGSNGGDGQEGSYTVPPYQKEVDGLDERYYNESCPQMEEIVGKAVMKAVKADETLAPSIIRLFFHDFAVGGVDGSVLIDVPGRSEKYADASRTLRGFELIEEIKKELEAKCHATVSCADALTAAARDAAFLAGVPYWSLKYGRKDRKDHSSAEAADRDVPMGGHSVTQLIAFFQDNGLNIQDLVVLSGAHTIGRATCGAVRPGLSGRLKAGTLDRQYGDFLQRKCRPGGDAEYVELDGETPTAFDNQYYTNLLHKKGLLDTDQKLLADSRTGGLVRSFAYQNSKEFAHQFAKSMRRLGEVQVLTRNEGEVRRKCSAVNY